MWCVFDCDSFPQYNNAIEKAHAKGFRAAYSNEAFELWYLLHFNYFDRDIGRNEYKGMLEERLGGEYEKNDPAMYEKLLEHPDADQQQAINWAKRLLGLYGDRKDYADHNPSTTVFKLVESLNEHVWQFRCQVAPDYPLPYPHSCSVCKKSTQPPPPYPYLKPS
ncbi:hypothetical protein DENIS_2240 [Desulfonema ishimotonii]|uniref:RloB domain-containing protein n=1 Tax=Desulfonema ishimotonii TaxID=45657 RepID=A0A401FWE3_9BACT|nr:RloB family protein [Desulfonema ishimotonii]GBC61280.1 hypothetical protein DENIS_2240 [Desulfonema ishimotonii]